MLWFDCYLVDCASWCCFTCGFMVCGGLHNLWYVVCIWCFVFVVICFAGLVVCVWLVGLSGLWFFVGDLWLIVLFIIN